LRLVVLGAGAIGSLFGGLLSEAGLDVVLIGRPSHVEAIKSHGLHINGVSGRRILKLRSEAKVSAIKEKPDIVLCTVKAYDTKQAAIDAKPLIGEDSLFLCIQNGLDVEREAAEVFGASRTERGVTNNGVLFTKPGYINHTGLGDTLIGCSNKQWQKRIDGLVESLNKVGLPSKVTGDIQKVVWSKVLINVGINAIGALTHLRNGDLLARPHLKDLMRSAVNEGLNVADKLGLNFREEDIVEKTFKVAKATSLNKNSMLQDLEKGRRTEIDFINGAIEKTGKTIGVPTPVNSTLTALLKGLESRIGKEQTQTGTISAF